MRQDERGHIFVEYALITVTIAVVMAAIVGASEPLVFAGWITKTRDAVFSTNRGFQDTGSILREIRER